MRIMFYNCLSLRSLPDISKLDTSNVKNMSFMFYNCKSLVTFPDISEWNTNNAIDIRGILDIIGIADNNDIDLEEFYLNYFKR